MKISGDSMEPLVRGGDIVLVNFSRHDLHRLTQQMVAAYVPDEDDATVKLLREDESKQFWLLLPYNPAHPYRVISKRQDGFQVAAVEAVFWE